jgi:hypothetical protein
MYAQDKEKELYEKLTQKLSEKDIWGNYKKPDCLITLETLAKEHQLNLETIGFFIDVTKPYFPAPTDIIPFASTGGDGCYFAFVTDFGYQLDLEFAPILFVSPTDFDKTRPNQANILFAANFNDFLSIMLQIWDAEIIRFKDVTKMDFDKEVDRIKSESIGQGNELNQKRKVVQEVLTQNFKLRELHNLNEYYQSLHSEREANNLIKTIDGIGIKINDTPKLTANSITKPIDINSLDSLLEKLTGIEKNKFYREAAYIYPHFKEDFLIVLEKISNQMKRDNLLREAKIIDFEIMQSRYYEEYLKIRKEKVNRKEK